MSWLSHAQFVTILAEAARRGDDLCTILAASVDHMIGCQQCQMNTSQIVKTLLEMDETGADPQLVALDLSQEDYGTILTFPNFELSFLKGETERPDPVEGLPEQIQAENRTEVVPKTPARQGFEFSGTAPDAPEFNPLQRMIEHLSTMPSSKEPETTDVPIEQSPIPENQRIQYRLQLPHEQMHSNAFRQMIEKATILEEGGRLAEAQAIYASARDQLCADGTATPELDARIRELQHRMRTEALLDRVAFEAHAFEEEGRWREVEQLYRRLIAETSSQVRKEEWSRAQRRCQVEMENAALFDEGLAAYEKGDVIGAIDRLNRVVHRRPDYVRHGTPAKKLLAQAKETWLIQTSRSPQPTNLSFRLVLGGGIVIALLLVLGIWFSGALNPGFREAVPATATPTRVIPIAIPSLPVASPTQVPSARLVFLGSEPLPMSMQDAKSGEFVPPSVNREFYLFETRILGLLVCQ